MADKKSFLGCIEDMRNEEGHKVRVDLHECLERASTALLDPGTPKSKKADLAQTVLFIRRLLRANGNRF